MSDENEMVAVSRDLLERLRANTHHLASELRWYENEPRKNYANTFKSWRQDIFDANTVLNQWEDE